MCPFVEDAGDEEEEDLFYVCITIINNCYSNKLNAGHDQHGH